MNTRKLFYNLHLILGLATGIIVFIVAITGCLYAFKQEIVNISQPYRQVPVQEKPLLPPSQLKDIARDIFPGRSIHGIAYGEPGDAAEVAFYEHDPLFYRGVFLNPYDGNVVKVKNYEKDFFYIIFLGHFQLWLPRHVGQPIVSWSVLIFVVILISGIILWWPKKNEAKDRFELKWKVPWKWRLYNIHSILGFYVHLVLLVIAITGLVWGLQWFSKAVYKVTGGQKELAFNVPESSPSAPGKIASTDDAVDHVWKKLVQEHPNAASLEIHYPENKTGTIYAHVNPSKDTYWKREYRFFDQFTLEEINLPNHVWGRFENASIADKIRRMNYDIHVGAIGGLPGKILVFLASLIAASLPITGFLMWWKKKEEQHKLKKALNL